MKKWLMLSTALFYSGCIDLPTGSNNSPASANQISNDSQSLAAAKVNPKINPQDSGSKIMNDSLMLLEGCWKITQTNRDGTVYTGTISFDQIGDSVNGSIDWDNHIDGVFGGCIKDDSLFFLQTFPDTSKVWQPNRDWGNHSVGFSTATLSQRPYKQAPFFPSNSKAGLIGYYQAKLNATGDTLSLGITTSSGGDCGKWLAVRLDSCPVPVSVCDSTLVAYWNADEDGTDTVLVDQTCYHNDGQFEGARRTTGVAGSALDFDGTNQAVIPVSASLKLTSFSISLWFEPANSAIMPLIESDEPNQRAGFQTWINTTGYLNDVSGAIQVNMGMFNGDWREFYTAGGFFTAESWHHLVVTFDASTAVAKTYVDNNLAYTDNLPSGTVPVIWNSLYLGWRPDYSPEWGAGLHYEGLMDEIRVYNTVLSNSQMATLNHL